MFINIFTGKLCHETFPKLPQEKTEMLNIMDRKWNV